MVCQSYTQRYSMQCFDLPSIPVRVVVQNEDIYPWCDTRSDPNPADDVIDSAHDHLLSPANVREFRR